jgi:hypothetical protein
MVQQEKNLNHPSAFPTDPAQQFGRLTTGEPGYSKTMDACDDARSDPELAALRGSV